MIIVLLLKFIHMLIIQMKQNINKDFYRMFK